MRRMATTVTARPSPPTGGWRRRAGTGPCASMIARSGAWRRRRPRTAHDPYGLAFSPAGDRLAVGYDDTTAVSLFDGHTLTPLPGPDTHGIDNGDLANVAWSADGATLYAGGRYQRAGTSPVVAWSQAGAGPRRELAAGTNTIMSLRPLPDGGLLVGAADPWLAVLDAAGAPRWVQRPPQADLRGQARTLRVSADGGVVDFGYEPGGKAPARFDLARLALTLDPPADGQTRPPEQATLKVEDWENTPARRSTARRWRWSRMNTSRSLAIAPDGRRFVLGTEWSLRAFDADGTPRWTQPAPAAVWATTITADGRLVVAAYGDGTLRWHRLDDGREVLALFPLADRRNWVAWTPEGFYAATPGAHGVLRWHVNRGWDAPAEAIPVAEIPETLPARGHPPGAPDAGHPPRHRPGGSWPRCAPPSSGAPAPPWPPAPGSTC